MLRSPVFRLGRAAARRLGCSLAVILLAAIQTGESHAQTARWVELPPPPCMSGSFFYDASQQRVILAGGALGPEDAASVWSLNLESGVQWTPLSTEVAPIFHLAGVVFDPTRDRLVGYGKLEPLFQTAVCTFDLSPGSHSWTQLATSAIPFINDAATYAYDPIGDRMIVFGGQFHLSTTNTLNALSFSGTPTWSTLTVPDPKPGGRAGATAVVDPVHARMLFFGGYTSPASPAPLDETWALSLSGSPAWTFLNPATAPAARMNHCAAYDPVGHRMIVLGGSGGGQTYFRDAWQMATDGPADSALWSPLPLFYQNRVGAAACVDSLHHRFLVYGGNRPVMNREPSNQIDLWALGLDDPIAWSLLAGPSGLFPGREGHASFVDASRHRLVVIGGITGNTGSSTVLADSWARSLDADSAQWTAVGANSAGPRAEPMTVVDPAGDRALLFGGYNLQVPADPYLNDLNAIGLSALSSWSPLSPPSPPDPRSGSLWVRDPTRSQAILYGGWAQFPNFHPKMFSDTWRYDLVSDTWQKLAVGAFGGRMEVTGIYDPIRDRLVAFGGRDSLNFFNDVHVLPLTPGGAWTPLATSGTPPPTGGTPRAVYDAARDRMIVIEDADPVVSTVTQLNVWALTLSDPPAWSLLAPHGRPPGPRFLFAADIDSPRDRVIVMGGAGSSAGLHDTWALYFDETTPAAVALQAVDVAGDRVCIRWFGADAPGFAQAFKRTSSGPWTALASLARDGTGFFTLEDRDVVAGGRYTYRLGVAGSGGMRYYGEVSVEVPRAPTLSLVGTRPSPAFGPLVVSFALPSGEPARLEVLDIQGRRVHARDVGTLGAGAHVLRLDPTSDLPAGVYVLRLSQGGRSVSAKAVIAR